LAKWFRDSGATQVLAGPQQVLTSNEKSSNFAEEVAVQMVANGINAALNN
jgi:hypothetical protein